VLPFRGANLFVNNSYVDAGAVQFYGIGIDNIVADCKGERMSGFIAWGQWRGYSGPGGKWVIPTSVSGGGGSGANPNLINQFLQNTIVEGNSIIDYNAKYDAGSGGYACFMNGSSFAVTDITHWRPDGTSKYFPKSTPRLHFPINSFQVIRGNIAHSDGGVLVEHLAQDVLVEGNTFRNSAAGVVVGDSCSRVLDRGRALKASGGGRERWGGL
jgi:hypothetical protein